MDVDKDACQQKTDWMNQYADEEYKEKIQRVEQHNKELFLYNSVKDSFVLDEKK